MIRPAILSAIRAAATEAWTAVHAQAGSPALEPGRTPKARLPRRSFVQRDSIALAIFEVRNETVFTGTLSARIEPESKRIA